MAVGDVVREGAVIEGAAGKPPVEAGVGGSVGPARVRADRAEGELAGAGGEAGGRGDRGGGEIAHGGHRPAPPRSDARATAIPASAASAPTIPAACIHRAR